jgi:hypothetical protein
LSVFKLKPSGVVYDIVGAEQLVARVYRAPKTLERWKSCKVLVIDEVRARTASSKPCTLYAITLLVIATATPLTDTAPSRQVSMLSGDFFAKLEQIARMVRGSPSPFGGIQLVLCGDFFQV